MFDTEEGPHERALCPDCEDFADFAEPQPGTHEFACSCPGASTEPKMYCERHYEWRCGRITCPDHGD